MANRARRWQAVADFAGNRRERHVRCYPFAFAGHSVSSCYAPHTKFSDTLASHSTRLLFRWRDWVNAVASRCVSGT